MLLLKTCSLCGLILLSIISCDSNTSKKNLINEELRAELLKMAKDDQDIRDKFIKNKSEGSFLEMIGSEFEASFVDLKNLSKLKEIVKKHGWPGKSLVCEDGADAAYILIQHATSDYKFQKECLKLMEESAKIGGIPFRHVAYLTDRLLILKSKKQIYGTQFKIQNGKAVPYPIEDEVNLDKRRHKAGLSTFDENKKHVIEKYNLQ